MQIDSEKFNETAKCQPDEGFVVPYVLAAILVLSLITVFAMTQLNRAVNVSNLIASSETQSQNIDRVQARILFDLLTATPMNEGYDFGRGVYGQARDFGLADQPENYVKDIWAPDGTWRLVDGVFVALQDESGLVPINSADMLSLRSLMELSGASPAAARTLAAELKDFMDYDNKLRPGGAERVQYRNAGLSEPPNEPIRHWAEIKQLRSWSKHEVDVSFEFLQKVTTLNRNQVGISNRYSPEALSSFIQRQQDGGFAISLDPLAFDTTTETHPSDHVRVTLMTLNDPPFIRQISVIRSVRDPEKPFQVTRVINRALHGDEVEDARSEIEGLDLQND